MQILHIPAPLHILSIYYAFFHVEVYVRQFYAYLVHTTEYLKHIFAYFLIFMHICCIFLHILNIYLDFVAYFSLFCLYLRPCMFEHTNACKYIYQLCRSPELASSSSIQVLFWLQFTSQQQQLCINSSTLPPATGLAGAGACSSWPIVHWPVDLLSHHQLQSEIIRQHPGVYTLEATFRNCHSSLVSSFPSWLHCRDSQLSCFSNQPLFMTGQRVSDCQIIMIQSQKVQQLFALLSSLLIESPASYTPVNHYVAKFLLSHNHSTLENEWFQ